MKPPAIRPPKKPRAAGITLAAPDAVESRAPRYGGRLRNVTLRQLRVFEAVATQLSYSRAAQALNLTQPAVSMQMQQLESEIGLALTVRNGKKVQLSQAGEEMLRQTRRILNQLLIAEDAMSALHPSESGRGGLLHLGVVSSAHYFAPALMTAFARVWPDATFKLTVERRETILEMLQSHQLEIAIAGYPPSEADVEAETFAQNPHCIVAAPSHPLASAQGLKWIALRDEPFIFREHGSATRQFFEHLLQSQALQVRVGMELAGNETVKQAVMAGMGVSFLSAHTFQVEWQAGKLAVLHLEGMPKMLDWCLLRRRDSGLSGVNEAFRRFVLQNGSALVRCRY